MNRACIPTAKLSDKLNGFQNYKNNKIAYYTLFRGEAILVPIMVQDRISALDFDNWIPPWL